MEITLGEVTRDNLRAVCELRVRDDQDGLVAPAAITIAESHYYPEPLLRTIEADGDLAGLLWVACDEAVPFLVRLMVDGAYQGRGIGRRAMELVEDELRTLGHRSLELSFVPKDGGPQGFYERCGYVP